MRTHSWASKLRPNEMLSHPIRWAGIGLTSIALIAAAAGPASASVTHPASQPATHAAQASGTIKPDVWVNAGTYGSFQACDQAGFEYYVPLGYPFRCVEINIGEPYFLWDLQVSLPTS